MIQHADPTVQAAGERIALALAELEPLFKPGVKLTLLARHPGKPEADIIITADDMDEIVAMATRRRDAEKAAGQPAPDKVSSVQAL